MSDTTYTLIIKTPKGKKDLKAVLREPTFDEVALISALREKEGKLKAGEILLNTCWITEGSDPEIKKDSKAKITACFKAWELIEAYDGELKKN